MDRAVTKRLCVYCGSGLGRDPRFKEAAETLGRAMADAGIGLVYGGGDLGLMGVVARTVRSHGGHVTGVIPSSLLQLRNPHDDISHVTEGLHERKMMMFNLSDGFVALPGGVGTLEELVEQLTWKQLGHHAKPIYLVNVAGYWDLFLQMIERMNDQLFIRPGIEVNFTVLNEPGDIVIAFLKHAA
jgi:uncharacterized protein (TIGR00730 family)